MGRKQSYFCDSCQAEFSDRPHINLEAIRLRVAYKTAHGWKTKTLNRRINQYHFCNAICLNEWIIIQVEGVYSQIPGGEHVLPSS